MAFVTHQAIALCAFLFAASAGASSNTVASAPAAPTPIAAAAEPGLAIELSAPLYLAPSSRKQYHLHMHHLHTGESLDVTYRVGNQYVPSAIAMLNHFLRDHRTGDATTYDPHEFDVLYALMQKLHRSNGIIDIVCGYRTPESNEYLRDHGPGVAEHSQHMLGKAIDIRVPGVSTRRLDRAAISLQDGGVGYYPHSKFVHVDVGPVRKWTLM